MFAICHVRTGAASQVVAIHAAQQHTSTQRTVLTQTASHSMLGHT